MNEYPKQQVDENFTQFTKEQKRITKNFSLRSGQRRKTTIMKALSNQDIFRNTPVKDQILKISLIISSNSTDLLFVHKESLIVKIVIVKIADCTYELVYEKRIVESPVSYFCQQSGLNPSAAARRYLQINMDGYQYSKKDYYCLFDNLKGRSQRQLDLIFMKDSIL